jgi:hypothetical protein
MLTVRGRLARVAATVLVVVLTLGGTFFGNDDEFPLGPFRMYSTRTEPTGSVNVVALRGRVEGRADELELSMASFGLRRAEVEGQLARIDRDPSLLAELVRAREAVRDDLPRLTELRLVNVQYVLEDGRRAGYRERILAEWRR